MSANVLLLWFTLMSMGSGLILSTVDGTIAFRMPAAEAERRYLWFPLHNGPSNQLLMVRRALMLGAVLNRTVLLPPLHRQHDVSYVRTTAGKAVSRALANQADWSWEHQEELLTKSLRASKKYFEKGSRYRALTASYDVDYFNISTLDMFTFYNTVCGGRLSVRGGCEKANLQVVGAGPVSKTRSWRTTADVENALGVSPFREAPILAVGSTFRMKGLHGKFNLSGSPSWLQTKLSGLQDVPMPFSRPIRDAARIIVQTIKRSSHTYSAVHLRMPDGHDPTAGLRLAENKKVSVYAQWALNRLTAAGIPSNSSVFVATNLFEGLGNDAFKDLCSQYNCFSLVGSPGSRNLMCRAGLCHGLGETSSLSSLTGLDTDDLMSVLDKQVCVLAEQGFWPSSGSCYKCREEPCPEKVSVTFAEDIISRRWMVCKPSCTGGSAGRSMGRCLHRAGSAGRGVWE